MTKQDPDACRLTREGLAFFGKLSASFSHEINNCVSIITEYSGLLSDLTLISRDPSRLSLERLAAINGKIHKQVKQAERIIKRFNRFAHSADLPDVTFDANQVLENLVEMTDRLASRRGIRFETAFAKTPIHVHGSPFFMQLAVFGCLEALLEQEAGGAVVCLTVEPAPDGCTITLGNFPSDAAREISREGSRLAELMDLLGCRVRDAVLRDGSIALILEGSFRQTAVFSNA